MPDKKNNRSDAGLVPCPICRTKVPTRGEAAEQNRHRPFCSARCQSIDLGNWLGGRYAVPDESTDPAETATPSQED